jgi:hypothetical protein
MEKETARARARQRERDRENETEREREETKEWRKHVTEARGLGRCSICHSAYTHTHTSSDMESPDTNDMCNDAWKIVFGFSTLGDLHHLAAVSRRWQRIVRTMPRIQGRVCNRLLTPILTASLLWRHVTGWNGCIPSPLLLQDIQHLTSITCRNEVDSAQLAVLCSTTSLKHLHFHYSQCMSMSDMVALTTPSAPQLLSMNWLYIDDDNIDADSMGDVVGALSSLTSFVLLCAYRFNRIDWLAPLVRLTSLTLDFLDKPMALGSLMTPDALIEGLRMLPGLTRLCMSEPPEIETNHLASILSGLPVLRTLNLHFFPRVNSLSFLSSTTPHLTYLTLDTFNHNKLSTTDVMYIVAHCRSLTSLELVSGLAERLEPAIASLFQPPSKVLPSLQHFVCRRYY